MNPFLTAYMKWITDMMTISSQVNQTVMTNSINQANGAIGRAKKQKVSATIHYLKINQDNGNG